MFFGKYGAYGRAVLLGTSALVASAAPVAAASFTIVPGPPVGAMQILGPPPG